MATPITRWLYSHSASDQQVGWGELLEFRLQEDSLPELLEDGVPFEAKRRGGFRCSCVPLSVDQQLVRRLVARDQDGSPSKSYQATRPSGVVKHLPGWRAQRRAFGPRLSRNRLARRLLRRKADSQARHMYRLQEFIVEAEDALRFTLEQEQPSSSSKQFSTLDTLNQEEEDQIELELQHQRISPVMSAVIRAPTLNKHARLDSEDSGFWASGEEHCLQVGGSIAINLRNNLEEHIRLHSNERLRRLVGLSLELFQDLVSGSPLFKVDGSSQVVATGEPGGPKSKLLGPQELRIYACVECQKLRSTLRFHWLSQCLETVFARGTTKSEAAASLEQLLSHATNTSRQDRLPPVELEHLEQQRERRLFDSLATLMGQLLRRHFLEPALASWCRLLEARNAMRREGPRLCLSVELLEGDKLASSDAQRQLKEALNFVVDELGATCRQLPRLETQLDALAEPSRVEPACIVALQVGDQLIEDTKRRIEVLVDGQRAFNTPDGAWVERRYSLAIDILNKFWAGKGLDLIAPLLDVGSPTSDEIFACARRVVESCPPEADIASNMVDSPLTKTDPQREQLVQLRAACLQLRLLEALERGLRCELGRYFDTGLVLLDCEPLRAGLLAHLTRERLLLVRLHLDDLLRLLERLRLHFDEIELGLDLEAAIDEHLAERWQAKQSQQPEQPVILAGDNLVDEDDHNIDYDIIEPPVQFEQEAEEDDQDQDLGAPAARQVSEEEEFAYALTGSSGGHQLLAIHNEELAAGKGGGGGSSGERRVAPLIECQLLVSRYLRLGELLSQELVPLRADVELALEGLLFLSDWVSPDEVQPAHWDLVAYLSARSQTFADLVSVSAGRLDAARLQLRELNSLRCGILTKLVLEFHQLMGSLFERRLSAGSSEPDGLGSIAQLDSIQEASEWAQKLELRFDFLWRQNALLAEERRLLALAKLQEATPSPEEAPSERTAQRRAVLEHWRPLTSDAASFWRLAEEYETQQVKWLNSDVKRVDFDQINSSFLQFTRRLDELESGSQQQEALSRTLSDNLRELRRRLELFQRRRLPIFNFLTNKHLTPEHWNQLAELLATVHTSSTSNLAPHLCTTLAQLLELGADKFVEELTRMSQEASAEHQLTEFLLVEAARGAGGRTDSRRSLQVSQWLEQWDSRHLAAAAARFLEAKLAGSGPLDLDCVRTSRRLVRAHDLVRRHLELRYSLNLDTAHTQLEATVSDAKLALRSISGWLSSARMVRPSLFLEFLRLFSAEYLERRSRLSRRQEQVENELRATCEHLADIEGLLERTRQLQASELNRAEFEGRLLLMQLERDTVRLELEREVLATREALALDHERRALAARDQCVRQIAERAVPAIRAAARALDCLDGRSLRALRSLRPRPPEPARLVLESVCLLRASASGRPLQPERRFDATAGTLHEDYWPAARKMLDSTLSVRFLSDLRQLDRRRVPPEVMRLIRRRYLSSSQFELGAIERVSRECALLARWLLAVDVFERVIGVVRPNYRAYLEAERNLASLLKEVASRRSEMEAIGSELRQLEEAFELRVGQKASLAEKLEECNGQLQQVAISRLQLRRLEDELRLELGKLAQSQAHMLERCARRSARIVYTDSMRPEERRSMAGLLSLALANSADTRSPLLHNREQFGTIWR